MVNSERFVAEARFTKLPGYKESNLVMCYVSTKEEPDTWWLLEKMLEENKTVCVPRVDGDDMDFYILRDMTQLKPGKFGIFEPSSECEMYTPQDGDVMAVPGVKFDEACNRKGHGRGYYDKYFAKFSNVDIIKIAFATESQMVEALENVQPHDVPMDMILTQSRVLVKAPTK